MNTPAHTTTTSSPRHLSVVIPAHNEGEGISETIYSLAKELTREKIKHEILVVNDHSSDNTEEVLKKISEDLPKQLSSEFSSFRFIENHGPPGFGFAIRTGLENFRYDAVTTVMADGSDVPEDVVKYYRQLEQGYECAFGSRFIKGGKVVDYPSVKLFLNRFGNFLIQIIFQLKYNDMTNAFKMYRKHVIDGLKPFLSHHFNLTVELPLKAIVRGYSYKVVPNTWINRKTGISKFKIREMGSRYMFIIIYCFIEKWLSAGDYYRKN